MEGMGSLPMRWLSSQQSPVHYLPGLASSSKHSIFLPEETVPKLHPMNRKGSHVTAFKCSSWTLAFGICNVLLFIQINLQVFKLRFTFLVEKSYRQD